MRRILALAACLLALPVAAAPRRAFEIADYYRTAFPGSPAVAPDGTRLAVAVTRYDLPGAVDWSEIWTMGGHGTRARQLTFGRHHDTTPVFSPDGERLVFVSDRGGEETQLFVMRVDGGEARQLTSFPLALSDPVFSPDGKWIAVTSRVYPECGGDADCNGTMHQDREGGPLKAHVADELLYRHWDHWRDGRFRHILLVDASTGEVARDLTPGRWDSPTFSLAHEVGYAFSPDSEELCYVSNHDPEPARSTNADLWTVPVGARTPAPQPRNLTAANAGWDGDPHYSPDGRFIAYRSQAVPGYESALYRLARVDRQGGGVRYLTDHAVFDNWVTALAWTPDGRRILFQADEQGRTPLYGIDVEGGAPSRILTDGAISGWRITPDGKGMVYTRSKVGEPPELYRASLAAAEPERITRLNADLQSEVDIRPAQEMWVQGAGDYKVQVFVVTPHDFDPTRTYPLILNVHGGPQSPWQDRYRGDWQVYPGKGYVVAFPNPTGSPGFGQPFVDAITCDWGGRVYDDLMKVTDALADIPYVDAGRMGAMGWSYGGYMMMWFEGHTDRFQAIAAMMGLYDLRSFYGGTDELWFPQHDLCGTPWTSEQYRRWSPSSSVERFSTPSLVITGERDFRVPYTQSLQYFTALQVQGVPSRLIVLPDASHWPGFYDMAFYYLAHLDWFHRWLGGGEPPWELDRFLANEVFATPRPTPAPDRP